MRGANLDVIALEDGSHAHVVFLASRPNLAAVLAHWLRGGIDDNGVPFIDRGTTKLNTTPIDRAIRCGHEDIVELLLRSGASPHVVRSSGDTPLSRGCASRPAAIPLSVLSP